MKKKLLKFNLKAIVLVFAISLICFSCKTAIEKNYVTISGNITNQTSDSLKIYNYSGNTKSIKIRKDGSFLDTLYLPRGYYKLEYDNYGRTEIFLTNGYELNLSISPKKDTVITYKGIGAFENKYLTEKEHLEDIIGFVTTQARNRDEASFLTFYDSVYTAKRNLLHLNEAKMNSSFIAIESMDLKYEKLNQIAFYARLKSYSMPPGSTYKASANFPNIYEAPIGDLKDENMLLSAEYLSFLTEYFAQKTQEILEETASDNFYETYWQTVANDVKNPKIFEELTYQNGLSWLRKAVQMDSVVKLLKDNFTNPYHLSEIDKTYTMYKKMERGKPAPNFELKGVSDNLVALKDLRGKLVYIDFWGTFCKPCFKLMPALHEVEEHFKGKDIHFVGLGMDPTDELWRKRIKEFNMGGIQLRSESRDHPFLQYFNVVGIPRFMLLDKQGNIIDVDARQPNDPKLIEELEALL